MKNDAYRLQRIYEFSSTLLKIVEERSITSEDIENDVETQWLITTPLYNIGEQVNALSQQFIDSHPEIPWIQIAGLRHRLVHDYEGTNWSLISEVVFEDLPALVQSIEEFIS